MFDIKENLAILPDQPGVYLYKDRFDEVIYVGKAVSLKNRVKQYFQSPATLTPKVRALVRDIDEFEYIITDTEMEALILENNLIKKYMPRYNVLLRDDKTYPYIKVTLGETYPRVVKTRRVVRDGGKYFGPYTDVGSVNQIIDFLNKIYPIKKCSMQTFPEHFHYCLHYHIGMCVGVCDQKADDESYQEMIQEILRFLQGNSKETEAMLQNKMEEASEQLEFERAAEFRDDLAAIQILREKQKIVTHSSQEFDVVVSADVEEGTNVMVFFIRNGKMIGRESYRLPPTVESAPSEKVAAFLKQYYGEASLIPREILVESVNEEYESIAAWLSQIKGSQVKIAVPQKGDKKALLEMGKMNLRQSIQTFEKRVINKKEKTQELQDLLRSLLSVEDEIRRIEAYDISNTAGVLSVGGMVVFENGRKAPKEYRKFKIKTVEGPNDYGSLQEVMYRRFQKYWEAKNTGKNNGFEKKPDLLLIDGGEKQVAAVSDVLLAMGVEVPVVGMVKDDRHRTRDLVYQGQLLQLKKYEELYRFIYFIQEEVHRFSIEYHKNLRDRAMTTSVLDQISGVGEKRRNALLSHFGSVERIRQADVEELAAVEGMNRAAAEAVKNFFSQK